MQFNKAIEFAPVVRHIVEVKHDVFIPFEDGPCILLIRVGGGVDNVGRGLFILHDGGFMFPRDLFVIVDRALFLFQAEGREEDAGQGPDLRLQKGRFNLKEHFHMTINLSGRLKGKIY